MSTSQPKLQLPSSLETQLLEFRRRVWTTRGRTVFNLLPEETLRHYQNTLEPFAG